MAAKKRIIHLPSVAELVPEHWSWSRLDEDSQVIDCPHSTPKLAEFGPLMVRSQDMRTGVFRTEGAARVTEETYQERIRRAEPTYGDVLYSREGTYFGIAAEVPSNIRVCLGQRMVLIRPDKSNLNFRFLRYWLNSEVMTGFIHGFRDGTVAERLNMSTIRALPVPLPPLPEQRAIAHILGALDDKIELNRQMNQTLVAMARAIFKSWFVDFDPVRANMDGSPYPLDAETLALFPDRFVDSELGPIPEGWEVGRLGDVADINELSIKKNYPYSSIKYIDISSVTEGSLSGTTTYPLVDAPSRARRLVRSGDTIWSTVRPNRKSYLYIHQPQDDLVVSTGFAVLTPKKIPASYLYSLVTTDDFVAYLVSNASGSAYPAVRADRFADADILIPQYALLQRFHEIVNPFRECIVHNENESRTLAELRDTLLPKLISGELRVPEVMEMMEEATA